MATCDQADRSVQSEPSLVTDKAVPRDHLIATAVKFLQNHRVRKSPIATRKEFLKKKGLSNEEVELALQQSGTAHDDPILMASTDTPYTGLTSHQEVQLYRTKKSNWREYGALAIILTGIACGFHQLYKKYLLPLIIGGRESSKQLQRIESGISEMSGSMTQTVTQLQTTLAAVQELLIQQQQKIQQLTMEMSALKATDPSNVTVESQIIQELKSEIYSLKGLLLNRRQFPPSPSASKIPAWQIPVKSSTIPSSAALNHNSSSDISPVSNESGTSSPIKEIQSPEGSKGTSHHLCLKEEESKTDVQGQFRMEVQGEEENKEDVGQPDEDDCISVQSEDRRGGDGQINEHVDKLRRPEGASNEMK
ncbi:hypothetical protein GDO86_012950 [Hymenochirus boettgeri]|uniref:Peroxisomal membrane protein PEX14 n=1 Tax=Hymenochirus boettgeri TaxID=247094 RepID=A0A8T2IPB9_9PIPI|nr:hypothetical protein GDO86_012950 [Hymenochirus boettgeri]